MVVSLFVILDQLRLIGSSALGGRDFQCGAKGLSALQPNANPAIVVRVDEHDAAAFQNALNLVEGASLHPAFAGFETCDRRWRDARRFRQLADT